MNPIGVIQGRLLPRPGETVQAFPGQVWKDEFEAAAKSGFDSIEWIFEANDFYDNPIWSRKGRHEMTRVSEATGVAIRSICADYFMKNRIAGTSSATDNAKVLSKLVDYSADIGAHVILLPLLETSTIDSPELREEAIRSITYCLSSAERNNIKIGLEMDLTGEETLSIISEVAHPLVGAYYDVGNSTSYGHDIVSDMEPLRDHLMGIHIKDRTVNGPSCKLGAGDTDFVGLFHMLSSSGYAGAFVLQHFAGSDPENEAIRAREFVAQHMGGRYA